MNIKINKNHYVTADSRQYILHKKKGNTEDLFYFTSINTLTKHLINSKIRMNNNIKTLKMLGDKIDQYANEIDKSFKDNNNENNR